MAEGPATEPAEPCRKTSPRAAYSTSTPAPSPNRPYGSEVVSRGETAPRAGAAAGSGRAVRARPASRPRASETSSSTGPAADGSPGTTPIVMGNRAKNSGAFTAEDQQRRWRPPGSRTDRRRTRRRGSSPGPAAARAASAPRAAPSGAPRRRARTAAGRSARLSQEWARCESDWFHTQPVTAPASSAHRSCGQSEGAAGAAQKRRAQDVGQSGQREDEAAQQTGGEVGVPGFGRPATGAEGYRRSTRP